MKRSQPNADLKNYSGTVRSHPSSFDPPSASLSASYFQCYYSSGEDGRYGWVQDLVQEGRGKRLMVNDDVAPSHEHWTNRGDSKFQKGRSTFFDRRAAKSKDGKIIENIRAIAFVQVEGKGPELYCTDDHLWWPSDYYAGASLGYTISFPYPDMPVITSYLLDFSTSISLLILSNSVWRFRKCCSRPSTCSATSARSSRTLFRSWVCL